MNVYDIIILVIIAVVTGAVIYSMAVRKTSIGCSSSCNKCAGCPVSCKTSESNKNGKDHINR